MFELHHRNPKVIMLKIGFRHGNLRMVKPKIGLHQRCSNSIYRNLKALDHKVVEFTMEFHNVNLKKGEASIGASPWRLLHPCEPMSG